MQVFFPIIIVFILFLACEPATSDINEEVVNQELVKKLIAGADSVYDLPTDSGRLAYQPFWVKGQKLVFTATSRSSVLYYDEQGRLSGMLEYEKEKLKDSIAFFPNGQRMFTLIIDKEGKASGPARFYYPDGRVREDGRFTGGIKTGVWREFNAEGRLLKSREFDRYGKPTR
jgi:hypothetical protein